MRIADRPWLGPLADAPAADCCVLLINRRVARVFLGGRDVLQAAAPAMEEAERRRIDERVDRLRRGSAHGTGATGLEDVLVALNARAVETIMIQRGYRAPGQECPRCGLLTTADAAPECLADGTPLERRDDVMEPALSLAVEQSAEVVSLPGDRDDLRPIGDIAAVLRFAPAAPRRASRAGLGRGEDG